MRDIALDVLQGIGIVTIIYFIVLNLFYIVFTGIAWRAITRHQRAERYSAAEEAFQSPLTPAVSILLPAFNEELNIVESVRSLMRMRYPRFEVVVVSDGSTDGTIERLAETFELVESEIAIRDGIETASIRKTYFSRTHPELIVIDKNNGGKADALNCGINVATYPYFCAVDADALLEETALLRVTKPIFDDPETTIATGGIVRIANGCKIADGTVTEVGLPKSILASLQVVEYFRAFLVGRVGWSRLRSLLIISGAFGVFDRAVVEAAGGYATDTVGEDVELVVRLHEFMRDRDQPYNIAFVPDPVCWTEAPEDLRTLGRQRRRWQRGLADALMRHRKLIGKPRYGVLGTVALPYFLLFELLGPIIESLGYVAIPLAVIFGALSPTFLLTFLVLAVLLGVMLSLAALALEEFSFRRHSKGREVARLFWLSIVENFGYRQLVGLWRTIALWDVVRKKEGWGKMQRKGLG